jgi:nucleoside-diphosphate-sugar epimerase
MKVLITGAAGFIGSNLADRLLKTGHEVIGADNFITGQERNIQLLSTYPRFKFLNHDVINPLEIESSLDWVMHFASPASPPKYLKYPMETLRVNSEGTYHLLELAKQKNAQFFFASTSEVYGDPEVHPQPETYWGKVNPNGPRSVYDEAKRYTEALIMAYHRSFQLPVRIIRIFNTYGPNMDIDDGRVVTNFIKQALTGDNITIYGDGKQTRSFQYIDDLINGILRLMEVNYFYPVNMGNDQEYTVMELAEMIKELIGMVNGIRYLPLPQDDPKQRKPDNSLARKLLNWQPEIPIREGLKKTIDYFRGKI